MGERGPLPQPDNVRQLRGNPGKRKPMPQVKPVKGAPACPDDLGDEAKAEWARIVPELERLGVLAHIDRAKLVNYVVAWEEYDLKRRALRTDPGEDDRAVWQQYRDAANLADSLGKDLYLSPGARARIRAPEPPEDDGDLD